MLGLVALALAAARSRAQEPAAAWVVWAREARGPRTSWITASGSVLRTASGIHVVVDGADVELRTRRVSAPGWHYDDADRVPTGHDVHASQLQLVRGAETTTLVAAPDLSDCEDVRDVITVVATVGSFAVARRDLWELCAGGAHGDGGRTHLWLDLHAPREVSASDWQNDASAAMTRDTPVDALDVARAARARLDAVCAERGTSEDLDDIGCSDPFDPDEPVGHVTSVYPLFADGRWRARFYGMIGVPYADTDGHTAYAIDFHVDGAALAPALEPYAAAPPAVMRFLVRHPTATMGGFSPASDAARAE